MSKILLSCRPRGHIEIFLNYIGIIFKKFRKILWNYLTNVPGGDENDFGAFERDGKKGGVLRPYRDGRFGRSRQQDFKRPRLGKGGGYPSQPRRLR